jgi:hypothetical protein
MKTTNKILLTALGIGLIISTVLLIKISSFVKINEYEVSGVIESREYPVENFNALKVKKGVLVNLHQNNDELLRVEADTALLKYFEFYVKDNTLNISSSRGLPDSLKVKVNLYTMLLSEISVESGGKLVNVDPFIKDSLALNARSGGRLNMNLDLSHLNCKVSSGANASLKGNTYSMKAKAESGANLKAEKLSAVNVKAEAGSGAFISCFVSGNLSVKANSGGMIKYTGEPQITNMDVSSGGKLSKKD